MLRCAESARQHSYGGVRALSSASAGLSRASCVTATALPRRIVSPAQKRNYYQQQRCRHTAAAIMRETGGGGALRRGNMAAAGELAARAASERVVAGTTGFRVLSTGASRTAGAAASRAAMLKDRNRKVAIYMASVVAFALGVTYAAVPLYKVFCQVTGFGGTTQVADAEKALKMKPVDGGRVIRVTFDGGTADTMPWKFRPTQGDVRVVPGETALAFFTAKNPSRKHITGVATYNVFPLKAGIYFNKIQCFCFEEQRLRAGEEIDMPVFFFLDPEMLDDPTMDNVNNVTLSYTFFQTAEEDAVEEDDDIDDDDEKQKAVSA